MVHRLFNIPLNEDNFAKELTYIHQVAENNGFTQAFVNKIVNRHQRVNSRLNCTTLQPIKNKDTDRRISVPHFPPLTNKLRKVLHRHGIELVNSSQNTLKSHLCNFKDKTPQLHNSGVYCVPCKNCNSVYIGQSRRKVEVRLQEHVRYTRQKLREKSSVAEHMLEHNHEIDVDNFCLLKKVQKDQHLDSWESLYISNYDSFNLMNLEDAPINSSLFYLSSLKL